MPHNPYHPPAKKFKPGSAFFRLDKNKPGMLLPKKGNNIPTPIDVQRKRLPIYQAKPQLLNQLRQLPSAILIGNVYISNLHNAVNSQLRYTHFSLYTISTNVKPFK